MGKAAQKGRGAGHRFKAPDWDNGTAYRVPAGVLYMSERWRKFTAHYLETYPGCARCKRAGHTRKARVARHIGPRFEGRDDYDEKNIQSLCFCCIGIEAAPMPPTVDDSAAGS